ncbi:MAG: TSUP family transporter [Schleiferiaceae bacterium]|jgi:uncharacterized membrane protein YfcA
MDLLLLAFAALAVSFATFFTGFGLGTLLTPLLLLWAPVEVAIGLTALVHLANNLFKVAILPVRPPRAVLLRFGLPAVVSAWLGSWLLNRIGAADIMPPILGVVLMLLAMLELIPAVRRWQFSSKALPVGGILSGFLGGLTGNQGALRSAFLVRSGLSKEALVASTVAISLGVDLTRISVYAQQWSNLNWADYGVVLATAGIPALVGSILGRQYLPKIRLERMEQAVSVGLFAVGLYLALG